MNQSKKKAEVPARFDYPIQGIQILELQSISYF